MLESLFKKSAVLKVCKFRKFQESLTEIQEIFCRTPRWLFLRCDLWSSCCKKFCKSYSEKFCIITEEKSRDFRGCLQNNFLKSISRGLVMENLEKPVFLSCKKQIIQVICIANQSMARSGSRTAAIFKMGRFVIIVNGFQPLTIITKHAILDVAAILDPPLD